MAPVVARYAPTLLLSSDLAPAPADGPHVEAVTGLTARVDARLREYDTGERTGLTVAEYAATLPPEEGARAGTSTATWTPPAPSRSRTSPSGSSRRCRTSSTSSRPTRRPSSCSTVPPCGSGGRLLGWPLEAADSLAALPNCGWAVLAERGRHRLRLSAYGLQAGGGTPDSRP